MRPALMAIGLLLAASVAQAQTIAQVQAEMRDILIASAHEAGVPPGLLIELCISESSLRPWAYGDEEKRIPQSWGLCQLHVDTATKAAERHGLYQWLVISSETLRLAQINADIAAWVLRDCYDLRGTWRSALDCFKAGNNGAHGIATAQAVYELWLTNWPGGRFKWLPAAEWAKHLNSKARTTALAKRMVGR